MIEAHDSTCHSYTVTCVYRDEHRNAAGIPKNFDIQILDKTVSFGSYPGAVELWLESWEPVADTDTLRYKTAPQSPLERIVNGDLPFFLRALAAGHSDYLETNSKDFYVHEETTPEEDKGS